MCIGFHIGKECKRSKDTRFDNALNPQVILSMSAQVASNHKHGRKVCSLNTKSYNHYRRILN
jgi:hypothetical protein